MAKLYLICHQNKTAATERLSPVQDCAQIRKALYYRIKNVLFTSLTSPASVEAISNCSFKWFIQTEPQFPFCYRVSKPKLVNSMLTSF